MRVLLIGIALLGLAPNATAADLPWLRGTYVEDSPAPVAGWAGFYGGVQAGASTGSADFSGGTGSLIAFILRNTTLENEAQVSRWTTLGKADTTHAHYGAFLGYNARWDEGILGWEINYNRTALDLSASDSLGRSFVTSDGFQNDVFLVATSSVHVTDYATIRGRAGWDMGRFLPYAFAGFAVGRADVVRSATVTVVATDITQNPPRPPGFLGPTTNTEGKLGTFAYGYAAGLGIDMMLMSNLFLRAEWEYIGFAKFEDQNVHLNSVRAAIGVKF